MSNYTSTWSGLLGCHKVSRAHSVEVIAHVWPDGRVSWFSPLVNVEDMGAVLELAKAKAHDSDQEARAARMADEFQSYVAAWIQVHPGTAANVTLEVRDEHRLNTIRPRSRRVEEAHPEQARAPTTQCLEPDCVVSRRCQRPDKCVTPPEQGSRARVR